MLKPLKVVAISVEFNDFYTSGIYEIAFDTEIISAPDFREMGKLFLAAPAMYEALRDAVNHCDECGGEGKIRYCPPSEKNWKEGECLVCKPWRDALKLAEGRG
jgi:hypothetical protein